MVSAVYSINILVIIYLSICLFIYLHHQERALAALCKSMNMLRHQMIYNGLLYELVCVYDTTISDTH